MKIYLVLATVAATASGFVSPVPAFKGRRALKSTTEEQQLDQKLDEIAHKLRLRVFDVGAAVYGFESKDPLYGIENIHTDIHMDSDQWLGLELTEVAHSDLDHRGLVMVSAVKGHALVETPIQVGDVIIGVFVGDTLQESTTGLDYDDTVDVLSRAKQVAQEKDGVITLEVNRLVKRAPVKVMVQQNDGSEVELQALAGDNLRMLLLNNQVQLYDKHMHRLDQPSLTGDCGGEGICGTCMVSVLEGMEHLNKIGPQERSILKHRPDTWRAACKTVVGADNQSNSVLRIRLHPQSVKHENLRP